MKLNSPDMAKNTILKTLKKLLMDNKIVLDSQLNKNF